MTKRLGQISRNVLLGSACLAAQQSAAVHVSQSGLGQVLIFPYYSVRSSYVTLLSVTNTQANTKILKVRFLEGKNGREVLDFNLFLSPVGMWTGAVVPTERGARIISNDNSCVTPSDLFLESRTDALGLAPNDFSNRQFSGVNADVSAFGSLDRTREGYFEIIEMGVIDDDLDDANVVGGTAAVVAGYARTGTSANNCASLDAFESTQGNTNAIRFPNVGASIVSAPRGGLTGRASLINAATGANYTFSPTALDAWSTLVAYGAHGSSTPTLASAYPAVSTTVTSNGTVVANWPDSPEGRRDAVSAAMMRLAVANEFVIDSGTASETDWIATFPTKRHYVGTGNGAASPPFRLNFQEFGACDPYEFYAYSRDAAFPSGRAPPFSVPVAPYIESGFTCWATSVTPFADRSLVASLNTDVLIAQAKSVVASSRTTAGALTTPALRTSTQGPNGFFAMKFTSASMVPVSARLITGGGDVTSLAGRHYGLPVIGFALHNYQNSGVVSRYGGVIDHKFVIQVQ